MDYLCYLNKEKIEELKLSKPIILRVEYKRKTEEISQVFKNDYVYLATTERPRIAMLKCKVLAVNETDRENEGQVLGAEKVYLVGRKKRLNRMVALIEVVPVERIWLNIDPSQIFLRSYWEPIGFGFGAFFFGS